MLINSRFIGFRINDVLADSFKNQIDNRPKDFKPKTVYGTIRTVQITEKPSMIEWKQYIKDELKKIIEEEKKEIEEKAKKDLVLSS